MFESSSSKKSADRDKFLEATRQAREERERDRRLNGAATQIQVKKFSFENLYFFLNEILKLSSDDRLHFVHIIIGNSLFKMFIKNWMKC